MGYRHINAFSMELYSKNFFIKRGQICEEIKSEDKKIDPLTVSEKQQAAYIHFINIDCTSNKQIREYCSEYGLLFNNIRGYRFYRGQLRELLYKMDIEKFVAELKKFRLIVDFYCDVIPFVPNEKNKNEQIAILKNRVIQLRKLSIYNSVYLDMIIDELQTSNDVVKINQYLFAVVKNHIQDYTNKIHINIDGNIHKTSETKTDAVALKGDLLSAMYFRFYLDIVNDVPIKKCKDPKCNNIFAAYKRGSKLYCSDRCCRNYGMREARKNGLK